MLLLIIMPHCKGGKHCMRKRKGGTKALAAGRKRGGKRKGGSMHMGSGYHKGGTKHLGTGFTNMLLRGYYGSRKKRRGGTKRIYA